MSGFDAARILAAQGRTGEASQALETLLRAEPDHVGALLLSGTLLLEARDDEQALLFFERATRVAPESSEAWNGMARGLHALARDEEALSAAQRARELLPVGDNFRHASPVYLTLVWCLREMRRYREALAAADEGLARCPDAVLAQWAGVVEEELAEAERERC